MTFFGKPPKRTCQILSSFSAVETCPNRALTKTLWYKVGREKKTGKSFRKRKRTCQIFPNDNLYWGVARPGYSLVQIHLRMRIAKSASGLSSKKNLTFWQKVVRRSLVAPCQWIELMSEGQRVVQNTTRPQESNLIEHIRSLSHVTNFKKSKPQWEQKALPKMSPSRVRTDGLSFSSLALSQLSYRGMTCVVKDD